MAKAVGGMRRARGQVEMIGLVIVVLLLVVGALFYVRFALTGGEKVKKDSGLEVNYASNLLNALLNVRLCDGEIPYSDGMVACFEGKNLCDSEACSYLESETKIIMNSVGLEGSRNYQIWIERDNEKKNLLGECKTGVKSDVKISGPNNLVYEVNLQLC